VRHSHSSAIRMGCRPFFSASCRFANSGVPRLAISIGRLGRSCGKGGELPGAGARARGAKVTSAEWRGRTAGLASAPASRFCSRVTRSMEKLPRRGRRIPQHLTGYKSRIPENPPGHKRRAPQGLPGHKKRASVGSEIVINSILTAGKPEMQEMRPVDEALAPQGRFKSS
jgi:hypothetical protein